MPTYSYACTQCGDRFDAVQAFTDEALTTCQHCSGRLRKLFGSVGVVFKGSGFYRTDSRESTRESTKASVNGSTNGKSTSTSTASSGADSGTTNGSSPAKSADKTASTSGSTVAAGAAS